MFTNICPCTKTFLRKTANQIYCSKRCQYKFAAQRFVKNHKHYCRCGQQMYYASKQCNSCYAQNRSKYPETMTLGDLKNQLKSSQYANTWANAIRTLARHKFKQYTACFIDGYNKHVEVCHIKPITAFSNDASIGEINHPSNISILCSNCHWEMDNLIISAPSIQHMIDTNQSSRSDSN